MTQITLIAITFFIVSCGDNPKDSESISRAKQEDKIGNDSFEDSSGVKETKRIIDSTWNQLNIKRIEAHIYVPSKLGMGHIRKNIIDWNTKELHPTTISRYSKELSHEQAQSIITHYTVGTDEEVQKFSCYYPHHGLVFYNSSNQVVAQSSICFDCNDIKSIPWNKVAIDLRIVKQIFLDLEIPILSGGLKEYESFE